MFRVTQIIKKWGYAVDMDGSKTYQRIEAENEMYFKSWDDVNNFLGYLVEGSDGNTITVSIKAEQEAVDE